MTDHENLDGMTVEGRLDYWRQRCQKLEQALEDLKDIGRAKAKLMRDSDMRDPMTEPEAHRLIQKAAMDTRRSMGAVAREILMMGVVVDGA